MELLRERFLTIAVVVWEGVGMYVEEVSGIKAENSRVTGSWREIKSGLLVEGEARDSVVAMLPYQEGGVAGGCWCS